MWLRQEQASGKRRPSRLAGFLRSDSVANSVSDSVIAPDLVQAYLETEYRVGGQAPFILRIGHASAALLLAHQRHQVDCSAFLTAFNPHSVAVSEQANQARQRALMNEITKRGLRFIAGLGQHPSNDWPGEESLLILGLNLEAAKVLGLRYEQNAIVWSGANATPQLVLLR